jgi:transposase, IS6 family
LRQHKSPFKWRHFEPTIILLCVRWYCRYQLSYRDLEEMMRERGLTVDHVTIFRWVQKYGPEINRRMRPHLKMSGASYRLDETYVKVGTGWKYLYRAVDSLGCTIHLRRSVKSFLAESHP